MTESDFIAAITDDPSDTLARLAYADWLEERAAPTDCRECSNGAVTYYKGPGTTNLAFRDCPTCLGTCLVPDGGTVRAEFVRIQCELAGKPICPDWCDMDPEKCRVAWLERCEKKLLLRRWEFDPPVIREMIRPWNERTGRSVDEGGTRELLEQCPKWEFRRGFIEKFSCPLSTWLDHGPEIVRSCPVSDVRMLDREPNDYGPPYDSCRFGWLVSGERGHSGPACLPRRFVEIVGNIRGYPARWPTAEDAHVDLSRACVFWARSETRGRKLRAIPDWLPPPA